MNQVWQLEEAKKKLNRVVENAVEQGPQIIIKHGVETAVVLSYDAYKKMMPSQKKLSSFFRDSPLAGVELDLERDKTGVREDIAL